jgi:hypothetical protein
MLCSRSTGSAVLLSVGCSLSGGAPNSRYRASGVLSQTLGWLVLNPYYHGWIPCWQGGRWATLCPNLSGVMQQPFADAYRLFECIVPLCHRTAVEGLWCILFTPRHCKTCVIQHSQLRPWSLCSLWYSKAAEEVGNQHFRHSRSLLVGNGVGFWPLAKIVHQYQFRWLLHGRGLDIILMNLAASPGPGAATGSTTSQHRFLPGNSSTLAGPNVTV